MAGPPDYDFWLFDLDGTLVDVDSDYPRQIFDQLGRRLGTQFDDEQVKILWHGLTGSRNEQLRSWGIDPEQFWPHYHEIEDAEARAAAAYCYADARRLLDALERPVGIVTHSQRYLAEPTLEAVGLREEIDALVCCDDELGWKPDPAPIEQAMADLGVVGNGDAGVLVGDSPQDVAGAHNAGLDAVHVERFDAEMRSATVESDVSVSGLDELV